METAFLVSAENACAAMARGLKVSPMSWGHLIAIAQKEMGRFQQRQTLAKSHNLHGGLEALHLTAAARILHTASNAVLEDEDESERELKAQRLAMLAACAYAMHANFPGARAAIRGLPLQEKLTSFEQTALCVCDPSRIGSANVDGQAKEFLEALGYFLQSGCFPSGVGLIDIFEQLMLQVSTVIEGVLLRSARLALKHLIDLSTARLFINQANVIPSKFITRLVDDGKFTLLPPQYDILVKYKFHVDQRNSLLSLPTSAGKTLIAEFALMSSFTLGHGLAVFIVPYVALGNQVYESLQKHKSDDCEVHRLFGGYQGGGDLIPFFRKEIVVITPERFDYMLRTALDDVLPYLTTVVVDEIHTIENGVRGARLEGIITRLRMMQRKGAAFRIVALSAVLSDAGPLCEWLGVTHDCYHRNDWRPTARRLAIWQESGSLTWLYGTDTLKPEGKTVASILGRKLLPWRHSMYATDNIPQIISQQPAAAANISYLARYLASDQGAPVLIICASRASTRRVASQIARDLEPIDEVSPEREALIECIRRTAPQLYAMVPMIEKGVAFHNATVPMAVKTAIEAAVRRRQLFYVAATTTLAEGVDLPFRVAIIYEWLLGGKDEQHPMSAMLFRNIAGRCGRSGEFTEGDTVIFENLLGNSKYTGSGVRSRAISTIFSEPPLLRSSASNDNRRDQIAGVKAAFTSQLMAAVSENPDEEWLEKAFAKSMYDTFSNPKKDGAAILQESREYLLDSSAGEPFARAASPIKLTDLGIAANATGLSPQSCRRLLEVICHPSRPEDEIELATVILMSLGTIIEQSNRKLRDISSARKGAKTYVKKGDIQTLVNGWLSGSPLHEMFANLPAAKTSKAAVKPADWVVGNVGAGANTEPVESQFDSFMDFMEHTFAIFLPWMLRGCGHMSQFGSDWAGQVDWSGLARRFEDARIPDIGEAGVGGGEDADA